jgi:hypothetical protein
MSGGGDSHGSWTDRSKLFMQGIALDSLNLGDLKIIAPS